MIADQYVTLDEPLYYFCRLDRYTPMTARFIAMGPEVTTALTQEELLSYMRDEQPKPQEVLNRGLHRAGCSHGGDGWEDHHSADNNHSIYWDDAFVHALGRPMKFWDLGGEFHAVLEEVFEVDPHIGSTLIRPYLLDLAMDDAKFLEALSKYSDLAFMQWFDEKCKALPEKPDLDNYDSVVAENCGRSDTRPPVRNDHIQCRIKGPIGKSGFRGRGSEGGDQRGFDTYHYS